MMTTYLKCNHLFDDKFNEISVSEINRLIRSHEHRSDDKYLRKNTFLFVIRLKNFGNNFEFNLKFVDVSCVFLVDWLLSDARRKE